MSLWKFTIAEEAFKLIEKQPDHPLIEEFKRRFGEKFEWARF